MSEQSMEQTELELSELESQIKGAKTFVERAEQLDRLEKNPDFKALIMEGFLEKHAVRQVLLKGHTSYIGDDKMQKIFDAQIMGVGAFRQFLTSIRQEATRAKEEMIQAEATVTEILEEQKKQGGVNG